MAPTAALLGFDIGTTAVKGAAYSPEGELLAIARVEYATSRPQPGVVEQDPNAWIDGILQIWQRLHAQRPFEPRALAICSQVNTHVFVDDRSQPLGPAIVWQDTRCASIAKRLDESISDPRRVDLWGSREVHLDGSSAISRAAWMSEHDPDLWARTRWVLSPKDYCVLALTGEVVTDRVSPIGLVGGNGAYIDGATTLAEGLGRRLPPLGDFDDSAGTTQDLVPSGVPVAVGTMDAWANLYGSGVTEPGQAMQVAGTSEILGIVSLEAHPSPGAVTFHPVRNRYVHAGPTQAGGDALRWFADTNKLSIAQALDEAQQGRAQRRPLVFLPHLVGERAPVWNANATAVWVGMTRDCSRAELAASVLEGVAYSARHLRETLEHAAGRPVAALRISGGAAASDLWNQIKADVHGCRIERLANLDSGTFGAALMGGVAAGVLDDLEGAASELTRIGTIYEPDPAERARYDALYRIYRSTYEQLIDVFDALSAQSARVQ